jgi:3D (Asp-Asp-Asp) domain-containing protein/septal ring factor EnvC (AmiA/AmiB activator)
LPLLAALFVAASLVATAASPGSAAPAPGVRAEADALRARTSLLRASADGALLELYAAQSALDRARAEQRRLDARRAALAAEEASTRRRVANVRRVSRAAQLRVHEALRALYLEGDVDPMAVILGATSLDEVLEGIEGLGRATRRNQRLVADLRASAQRLERLQRTLSLRRGSLDVASERAAAASARLERAVSSRGATLRAIQRQIALTAGQVQRLEARAAAASAASARIAAPPARSAAAEAPPPTGPASASAPATSGARLAPGGSRRLVVDAVAYHLPGRTASGLPVGIGVIAVDPRVIPLGTKVYVPGYGPAVAADVGTAIIGNIIDLWMPSTAHARAWGRRTVTITVYG